MTTKKTKAVTTKQKSVSQAPTPAALLEMAVSQNADLEKLEKLMELQERWEVNEARKAYHAAMTAFKKNPPEIEKDKQVEYKGTRYDHASLYNTTKTINSALSEHGLTSSWKTEQSNGQVAVTCIITHELGHSEYTTLYSEPDATGSKNKIQSIGSAVTYLQRYTLLALTGLATKDQDNDGRSSYTPELVSDSQLADLIAMMQEKNVDVETVINHFKVKALDDLNTNQFKKAVNMLAVTQ